MKPFGPWIVICQGSVLDDAQEKSPLTGDYRQRPRC